MLRTPVLAFLGSFFALARGQIPQLANFANRTSFPNEQTSNVTKYLTEAASLVTDPRLYPYFVDRCIGRQVYPWLYSLPSGYVKPFEAFDNLYFVGHTWVSAWAYDTGDGLLVIDALDNSAEIEAIMLPMLKELGYQGTDIKNLIITHEHIDHYGGAKYLQDNFGTKVYGSGPFWEALALLPPSGTTPPPTKGETLVDGQQVTFGNLTVTTVATPGHTLGTISLMFPVYDHGEAHVAGFSGGTGNPNTATLRAMKVKSQKRFADIATQNGVDVLLSNHQVADYSVQNADILEHKGQGVSNPFIVGVENFANYMRINAVCTQATSARDGMNLEGTDDQNPTRRSVGSLSPDYSADCHM